jgi:mannose-1-phosphate guanylyltransferase
MKKPLKSITTAMILAAGLGQRLMPLTSVCPKPLLPILNNPMLFHLMEELAGAGIRRVVVNAHHLAEQMIQALKKPPASLPRDFEIQLSLESELLGTGGGLKKAVPLLFPKNSPAGQTAVLVINSDIYTDIKLRRFIVDSQNRDNHASRAKPTPPVTLALVDCPEKATVSLDSKGNILAFRSKEPVPGEAGRLCGAGLMIVERFFIDSLPNGNSDVIEHLNLVISKGRAPAGYVFPEARWTDIGTFADYFGLNRRLVRGRMMLEDPKKIHGRLSGFVIAQAGAIVEYDSVVEKSVLLSTAVVEKGAKVVGSVVAGWVPAGSVVENRAFV